MHDLKITYGFVHKTKRNQKAVVFVSARHQSCRNADTVETFNPETHEGTGFSFTNYNAHDMLHVIKLACSIFQDKKRWTLLMKSAMKADHSWKTSAKDYVALYSRIIKEDFHVS